MENEIKKQILEINSMNLPQIEKSKMIFNLMNPNIEKFHEKKRIYCTHSKVHLNQLFKCCNNFYPCRFCHDQEEDHEAKRFDIDIVKCDFCNVQQKKGSVCNNPECYQFKKNHNYYCSKCNIWKNDNDNYLKIIDSFLIEKNDIFKKFYHCDNCGICRVGNSKDYKHCDSCNLCLKKEAFESHVCKINMKDQDCPICFQNIWNNYQNPYILKCGHAMHYKCFVSSLKNNNFYCSTCRKAIVDLSSLWLQIDNHMVNQEMPEEYSNWESVIKCRECETQSNVKYHFEYHKCSNQDCGCYNTDILKINKN